MKYVFALIVVPTVIAVIVFGNIWLLTWLTEPTYDHDPQKRQALLAYCLNLPDGVHASSSFCYRWAEERSRLPLEEPKL